MSTQQSNTQQVMTEDHVYKNRYLILGIILIGMFMSILDGTMVSIALPTVTSHFHVNLTESQWVVTGYLLAMTGLFIFFAKVSEYAGKAKMFMAGWAIFTVSSLACGLAPGLNELIAFRIAQGIGASMVSGVAGAMIYLAFPPAERGKAMGLFGVVFGAGALIGPGLGGFIVDNLGWQYIFLINVPIGVLLLALALAYLKVPEITVARLEVDWIGAATLFVSVVSVMLLFGEVAKGMTTAASATATAFMAAYAIVFALAAFAFLFWESRCAKPLLELSIFANRNYTLPVVSGMLLYVAISIATTLQPFYFELVMGYTPSQVGLISMIVPLFLMFSAPLGGALYDQRRPRLMAAAGVTACGLGFIVMGYGVIAVNFWLIVAGFVLRGIGSGFFSSPNSVEIMSALPKEKTAIASSVQSTAIYLAMMLGVALSTILLSAGLDWSGYSGPVFLAEKALLSNSIGVTIAISAALCMLAGGIAAARSFRKQPSKPVDRATGV